VNERILSLEEAARASRRSVSASGPRLERERAARLPGATGPIPNLAGAQAAAARLARIAAIPALATRSPGRAGS
jgi:hypothetical protein